MIIYSNVEIVNKNVNDFFNFFFNIKDLIKNFLQTTNYLKEKFNIDIEVIDNKIVISHSNFGKISISIISYNENDFIKYGTDKDSKIEMFFWVQMKYYQPYKTKFRLAIKVNIPFFLAPFYKKKIKQGLDDLAKHIAKLFG